MVLVYLIYAAFAVALTIYLAQTLRKNGEVLLSEVFVNDRELGRAVNRLLVVGFYLVNFGYACLMLSGGRATDLAQIIETLANKMGWLLLSLAAMHFSNLLLFHRIRRRSQLRARRDVPIPAAGSVHAHFPPPTAAHPATHSHAHSQSHVVA